MTDIDWASQIALEMRMEKITQAKLRLQALSSHELRQLIIGMTDEDLIPFYNEHQRRKMQRSRARKAQK